MSYQYSDNESEDEISKRRAERVAKMKAEKARQMARRKLIIKYTRFGLVALVVIAIIAGIVGSVSKTSKDRKEVLKTEEQNEDVQNQPVMNLTENTATEGSVSDNNQAMENQETENPVTPGPAHDSSYYQAYSTGNTRNITSEEIISEHCILINNTNNEIVASRDAYARISPASMTKVLTVLVAAEHVTNLDDTFTMTLEQTDYAYVNDCSSVGFLDGEVVPVRDLFYGTILPSGGDAATALAAYVAGSHEAFVDMMNDKLKELGLSDTAHFTNCVGIYNDNHYCSIYDMAVIMKAAMENELCRDVMSAHVYTTAPTPEHPEGITISNWFLRRIEDKETGGEVLCAKTGFVNQSKNCAVSYILSNNGNDYILATAGSSSSWRCIYDHVAIYNDYIK